MIQCNKCGIANPTGTQFCSSCGNNIAVAQQSISPGNKSNLKTILIVLGCIIGSCVLCGIIGAIGNLNKKDIANSSTSNVQNTSNSNVALATPTPTPTFAELKSKTQPLLNMGNGEHNKEDLKRFDDVMKPLREIPKEAKEYKEAQALIKQLINKSSVIGAEIVVLGDKPENSSWDGSVRPAEKYLKEALNDYSSSEYLGWSPVTKIYIGKEPYWGTKVKLRAKNAFGAFIVKDIVFFIRNNQVVKVEGL
jgi:hypothetical protein